MRQRGRRRRGVGPAPGGFTLLEVVVAITILGMVLGISLELMGVGLRSAGAAGDYTREVLLARQKLQDLSLQQVVPRTLAGAADPYQWTAEVAPADGESGDLPPRLFTLRVKVWRAGTSGTKLVELVTYRVGGEPPTTSPVSPAGQPGGPGRPGAPSPVQRGAGR